MNSESEPSAKKKKNLNPSLSLFSLPDDITFASLVSSYELYKTRCLQNTYEEILHVCLQFPMDRRPSWFSLWLKPNQTLTNDLERKEKSSRNALLVQLPSSYCPHLPLFMFMVGSEWYAINQYEGICDWCEVPNMIVARGEDAIAGVLNEKIYVMGGCSKDESKNWAEVFDTNTQTWESLPDPGVQVRCSPLKRMEARGEKSTLLATRGLNTMFIVIENVRYYYGNKGFLWYDEKLKDWRTVNGLSVLVSHCRGGSGKIEMAEYSGKLLMIWDKYKQYKHHPEKEIWCALIALEMRNNDGEVWGKVEWANIVRTVPSSCVLLRSEIRAI
ncbi:hypothetical protein Bca101_018980 [Brassica carinata]